MPGSFEAKGAVASNNSDHATLVAGRVAIVLSGIMIVRPSTVMEPPLRIGSSPARGAALIVMLTTGQNIWYRGIEPLTYAVIVPI